MATNRAVTNGMFDSFAGPASELPPGKRTPSHVLAALRINPRVGTFDMSETPWLRGCIDSLKNSGHIVEDKDEPYPWHLFLVQPKDPPMTTTPTSGAADLPEALRPVEPVALIASIQELNAWEARADGELLTQAEGESIILVLHELKRLLALAAGQATAAQAVVPAGWKLMPVEPTDGMVQAAYHLDLSYMPGQEGADRAAIYRAMLAAAPVQPAAPQGVAYAALPRPYCYEFREPKERYTTEQMRAFADATCALRVESLAAAYRGELDKLSQRNYEMRLASHGQAPAGAQNSVLEDALSDAVRVPLDSLHADAAYLIGRLRDGSMPYARVIEIIRERIDAAKAAIRARAAHGQAPAGATKPTEQQILEAAEKAGLWPNTVHSWIPAFHRYHKELAKAQPAPATADSVQEDAARLERERICAAIKAEDDYCVDNGDYMLDSDDCIKIVRGEWVRPAFSADAARKQGASR